MANLPKGDDIIELSPQFRQLIRLSTITVDPSLIRPGANPREATYCVDDGWRRLIVQAWFALSPRHARLALWLIAREAAAQSRAIRILATEASASLGFCRDIQALCALVSSVDPTSIRPRNLSPATDDAYLETIVLPSLDDQLAQPPDATLAIRYAFLQLYRHDFEGDAFQHQADDATLRLSVLLPFFEPQAPWLRIDNIRLEHSLSHYTHLKEAFSPAELVRMLTSVSMAAIRLRRLDLVCAAARLAEQSAQLRDAHLSSRDLLLPLRAEIEAGMLCGGNPDDFRIVPTQGGITRRSDKSPLAGTQVSAVCERIIELLQTTFALPPEGTAPRDLQLARAKLYARLGEALHITGDRASALRAFHQALAAEHEFSRHAVRLGAVLGGRGARSYLRLLLDRARTFPPHWPQGHFKFKDGLVLPIPARVSLRSEQLIEARRIFELNARRLGRGRGADKIGARIDAARIYALLYDFDAALQQLDLAAASRFANGTSIEVLLELLAVRTRISVDAAIVALIAFEDRAAIVDPAIVANLAHFLSSKGNSPKSERRGSDINMWVAKALAERARTASEAFHRYAANWGRHHPYYTFSCYMRAWGSIIASRFPSSRDARLKHLHNALIETESARHQMYEGDYCMHFFEAGIVVRALRKVLCQKPPAPPTSDKG